MMDRYDIALMIGGLVMCAGVWMIHQPAALIVLGAMLILGSLYLAPPADNGGQRPDLES